MNPQCKYCWSKQSCLTVCTTYKSVQTDREKSHYQCRECAHIISLTTELTYVLYKIQFLPQIKLITHRTVNAVCYASNGNYINLYEPYVLYIGRAHRYPPNTPFYIYFQQIYVLNFLNMLHTLRLFLFKMPFIS
jgi:hypothetical protein